MSDTLYADLEMTLNRWMHETIKKHPEITVPDIFAEIEKMCAELRKTYPHNEAATTMLVMSRAVSKAFELIETQ